MPDDSRKGALEHRGILMVYDLIPLEVGRDSLDALVLREARGSPRVARSLAAVDALVARRGPGGGKSDGPRMQGPSADGLAVSCGLGPLYCKWLNMQHFGRGSAPAGGADPSAADLAVLFSAWRQLFPAPADKS